MNFNTLSISASVAFSGADEFAIDWKKINENSAEFRDNRKTEKNEKRLQENKKDQAG